MPDNKPPLLLPAPRPTFGELLDATCINVMWEFLLACTEAQTGQYVYVDDTISLDGRTLPRAGIANTYEEALAAAHRNVSNVRGPLPLARKDNA